MSNTPSLAEDTTELTHAERVIARQLGLDGAYRVLAGMEYCAALAGKCTVRGLTVRRAERDFTYQAEGGPGWITRIQAGRYLAAVAPGVVE